VGQLVVGDSSVQSQTFERTTPRVTVSADVNKQTMTYLTYSEGFKSGGFNGRYTAPVPGVIPFKPEFVKMTEAGVKYQNDYLRLNAAVYQTKYSDIQVNYRPNPLQVLTVIGNAARAEINGAEVEFTLVPTKAFRIEGSLGVIDANYTQVDPGLIPAGVNLTTPFVNTPHTSGSIGASYAFDLADMGTLTPRIDYSTRTKVSLDNTDSVLARQAGVSLVNANITWENKGGDWQAVLGGTNLTDEQYLVTAAFSAGAGLAEGIYARPREWYLSLRKSF
jgi:iron complex outermembrane receptor protein